MNYDKVSAAVQNRVQWECLLHSQSVSKAALLSTEHRCPDTFSLGNNWVKLVLFAYCLYVIRFI